MKTRAMRRLTPCLAVSLLVWGPAAFTQDSRSIQDMPYAPVSGASVFAPRELDQMLAPIALYPDSLLTQILMASTYPLEVVQAARWSRANPGYQGDQAVRAVEQQNWDPSVKSLVAFPQILDLMDNTLDWTERLGDAFIRQEAQVWDTVQNLRQRADASGHLQSNERVRVEQEGPIYVIESPRPDVIYVPYYDPLVVYGDWWWPGYAPMRWSPWPGYYARGGFGRGYFWDSGISVGFGFFFGGIDWRLRHVNIVNRNSFYYRHVNRRPVPGNGWQHDPDHRDGVPYRQPSLRQQFNRTQPMARAPDAQRDYGGRSAIAAAPAAQGYRGQQGSIVPGARAAQTAANPVVSGPTLAPGSRAAPDDPTVQRPVTRHNPEHRPQSMDGVNRGQDTRDTSSRGQPATLNPHRSPQIQPQPQHIAAAPVLPAQHQNEHQQQQVPNSPNAPRQRGEPPR